MFEEFMDKRLGSMVRSMRNRVVSFIMNQIVIVTEVLVCVLFMVTMCIEFMMRQIVVIVVHWVVMALIVTPMLISMMPWVDSLVHVMVWLLDNVGSIMMDWFKHHSLVMCLRIEVVLLLIVNWLRQVHLFAARWV